MHAYLHPVPMRRRENSHPKLEDGLHKEESEWIPSLLQQHWLCGRWPQSWHRGRRDTPLKYQVQCGDKDSAGVECMAVECVRLCVG